MIKVEKQKDKIILSITTELDNGCIITLDDDMDREDVYEFVSSLNKWLEDTVQTQPSQFHNEAHKEAYEQAQRKLRLEKEMKRMFVDVFDDEYLETKFATVYKLDALNREIEVLKKKLNKL